MTEINQGDLEQVHFKQEDNKLFIQKSGNHFLTQIIPFKIFGLLWVVLGGFR